MKKNLKLLLSFIFIFSFNQSFAASTVDHFDIKFWSTETTIGNPVDITIEAKDKSWNTVKDYKWTILVLSETDPKAVFPKEIKDNSYSFKEASQWKAVFTDGLTFKTLWKQQVNVFDFDNEEILWLADINVIDEISQDSVQISILSPSDWVIETNTFVNISWKTIKNRQVVIKLTWTKTDTTIKTDSNSEWLFNKVIENLDDWEYTIKASIFNNDNKEVWVTPSIKINIRTKKPEYYSLKIMPFEIYTWSKMDVELKATKWLKEVTVTINDDTISLVEAKDWLYTWSTNAPDKVWEYNVKIKLIDDIWNEVNKELLKEFEVLPNLNVECDPEIDENCELDNYQIKKKKIYKINNLQILKLKTKSILSWDAIDEAVSYNIYKQLEWNRLVLVDNVRISTYQIPITWKKITYDSYVVEPVIIDWSWETIKWELSAVTEIQTWPKELLILLFLSFLLWLIILVFKSKKLKL